MLRFGAIDGQSQVHQFSVYMGFGSCSMCLQRKLKGLSQVAGDYFVQLVRSTPSSQRCCGVFVQTNGSLI